MRDIQCLEGARNEPPKDKQSPSQEPLNPPQEHPSHSIQLPNLMLVDPKRWKNVGEFIAVDTTVMGQDMVILSYILTFSTGCLGIAKVVLAQTKA